MGMGPWAQAEFMRDIERSERARFRRAVAAEIKRFESDDRVLLPDNEVLESLNRIRAKITPRPIKRSAQKRDKGNRDEQ